MISAGRVLGLAGGAVGRELTVAGALRAVLSDGVGRGRLPEATRPELLARDEVADGSRLLLTVDLLPAKPRSEAVWGGILYSRDV